jgi:hypothetical protein
MNFQGKAFRTLVIFGGELIGSVGVRRSTQQDHNVVGVANTVYVAAIIVGKFCKETSEKLARVRCNGFLSSEE